MNGNLLDGCVINLDRPGKAAGSNPGCVAVNSTLVFWIDDYGINSTPISSPHYVEPTILYPGPLGGGACLDADEDRVYFTDPADGTGTVRSILVDGGAAGPDGGPLATDQGVAYGIKVFGNAVYWTSNSNNEVLGANKLDGTNLLHLARLNQANGGPVGLAVDTNNVYWANASGGTIMKVPLDGGLATILASGESGPEQIAVDGNSVYWGNDGFPYPIKKMPLGGLSDGGPETLAKSSSAPPSGLVVDSNNVYWTSSSAVSRVSIDGGASISIDQIPANRIAIDSQRLYWTSGQDALITAVDELSPK